VENGRFGRAVQKNQNQARIKPAENPEEFLFTVDAIAHKHSLSEEKNRQE
jgi:hypothetical protein